MDSQEEGEELFALTSLYDLIPRGFQHLDCQYLVVEIVPMVDWK